MFSRLHHRKPHDKDVEAGDAPADGQNNVLGESSSTSGNDVEGLGEYAALDRFVSTYREDAAKGVEDDATSQKKRPWWKFWGWSHEDTRRRSLSPGDGIPEDWLSTDINTGIHTADVEPRRKVTGWNELTAEKTNPIAQFIGYFQGPILYGKLPSPSPSQKDYG
jgi:H+-transporting ATPase